MKPILLAIAAFAAALAAPLVASTPAPCSSGCTVMANSFAYVPPVFELASGASVRWDSLDTSHVNADGLPFDEGLCVFEFFSVGSPSRAVRFDATASGLVATDEDGLGTSCANARAVPGGYALPYWCVLHPIMRGALIVSAS